MKHGIVWSTPMIIRLVPGASQQQLVSFLLGAHDSNPQWCAVSGQRPSPFSVGIPHSTVWVWGLGLPLLYSIHQHAPNFKLTQYNKDLCEYAMMDNPVVPIILVLWMWFLQVVQKMNWIFVSSFRVLSCMWCYWGWGWCWRCWEHWTLMIDITRSSSGTVDPDHCPSIFLNNM